MPVLGLETSCDETSAAVVEGGRRVLAPDAETIRSAIDSL
jgi:tRNA A37 threonylcarbamoyltransferase TsaD